MLAFVHIEKCAGTTLIHLLRQSFFLDHCDVIPRNSNAMIYDADDLRHLLRLRPNLKSISGHSIRPYSDLQSAADVTLFTLLRDPVARYISDYQHLGKSHLLDRRATFQEWLRVEARHNFQTRAIAGEPNLDLAIAILKERVPLVGIVEQFDMFVRQLNELSVRQTGVPVAQNIRPRNSRSSATAVREERRKIEREFAREIQDANRLDLQLYEFVRDELLPRQHREYPQSSQFPPSIAAPRRHRSLDRFAKTSIRWLYRNLVYKPYVGRVPFKPHALPIYENRRCLDAEAHDRVA
jgi:hypothetical protein